MVLQQFLHTQVAIAFAHFPSAVNFQQRCVAICWGLIAHFFDEPNLFGRAVQKVVCADYTSDSHYCVVIGNCKLLSKDSVCTADDKVVLTCMHGKALRSIVIIGELNIAVIDSNTIRVLLFGN